MTPEQEAELVGGGITHAHSHEFAVSHDQLARLQSLETAVSVTANYTMKRKDDFILVDTTSAPVTITLLAPNNGARLTIIRVAGANNVTVTGATINGAGSATISTSYAPLRLKAFDTAYIGI